MRLTQAAVIHLSPAWFYRNDDAARGGDDHRSAARHDGSALVRAARSVPLDPAACSPPMRSSSEVCSRSSRDAARRLRRRMDVPPAAAVLHRRAVVGRGRPTFFAGKLLVGVGFFVYCIDVLEQTTATYGGLRRALGISLPARPRRLGSAARRQSLRPSSRIEACSPAPSARRSCSRCSAARSTRRRLDALWAKNLIYFFGHSIANLTIYLAAGAIYVLVPRYAGRPWKTTKAFVAGWLVTLVFVATAYSHHLYMDFVQPELGGRSSQRRLVRRAIPVAVVTIYTDDDAHLGLALPVDARLDAPLPRLRRLGDRRHRRGDRLDHPDQLPPPQHDLGRRALPHLPDARRRSSGRLRSSRA